jgi:hypothetical protein
MKSTRPKRIKDYVYVIGAGFSAGLGYPLTKSLLIDVWNRLDKDARTQLRKIIDFHQSRIYAKEKDHPSRTSNRSSPRSS